jgi:3-dehydroquinate synthetase
MRDKRHYQNMMSGNHNATVGFSLAADAVYASRYGSCDASDHQKTEWRQIAGELRSEYGDNIPASTVVELMHDNDKKIQYQLYIPQGMKSRLEAESEKTGAPIAEIVRRAVEKYLQ